MNNPPKTPLWVLLAFSAIETRRAALILITCCIVFTLYSIPWSLFAQAEMAQSLSKIFLIDDWSWAGMMVPICLWYIASLMWMDKHNAWLKPASELEAEH